jgi:hypothetical protein
LSFSLFMEARVKRKKGDIYDKWMDEIWKRYAIIDRKNIKIYPSFACWREETPWRKEYQGGTMAHTLTIPFSYFMCKLKLCRPRTTKRK